MTAPLNNVICMKWGDKYSADYVNILFNMVSRNLSIPFRFVCFTDDPQGIDEQVEVFDLPSLNLPNNIPERGWLKLTTFSKTLGDLEGKALFLDLDLKMVITTTNVRAKKVFFPTPQDHYEVSDHDIRKERSSDDPFQVFNVKFPVG